jgi:hypothetical protein
MVTIHNILDFINLLIIFCITASTIDIWVIISSNYSPLKCIISLINLCNIGYLILLKFQPKYIDTILIVQNNFYILTSIIQFYSGLLMLGISTFNIFLGAMCILSSLYNCFFVIININIAIEPNREETPFGSPSLFTINTNTNSNINTDTINKTDSSESINTITDDDSVFNN